MTDEAQAAFDALGGFIRCCECKKPVPMADSSIEMFAKRNWRMVCDDCFNARARDDIR